MSPLRAAWSSARVDASCSASTRFRQLERVVYSARSSRFSGLEGVSTPSAPIVSCVIASNLKRRRAANETRVKQVDESTVKLLKPDMIVLFDLFLGIKWAVDSLPLSPWDWTGVLHRVLIFRPSEVS